MKTSRIIFSVFIFMFLIMKFSNAQNVTNSNSNINNVSGTEIIKSKSIGEIRLGMPIDDFLKLSLENKTIKKELINLEGDDYDIYNVYENGQVIYAVEPDEEKAWRIWIYSGKIKTEKGICIGNTLKDIRTHYQVKEFVVGEGAVAIIVKNYEYSFILESAEIPENWWRNQKLETLNDNLKIGMIIIT